MGRLCLALLISERNSEKINTADDMKSRRLFPTEFYLLPFTMVASLTGTERKSHVRTEGRAGAMSMAVTSSQGLEDMIVMYINGQPENRYR
jgi:hypothetical protein